MCLLVFLLIPHSWSVLLGYGVFIFNGGTSFGDGNFSMLCVNEFPIQNTLMWYKYDVIKHNSL